jgi:hypothetical protein
LQNVLSVEKWFAMETVYFMNQKEAHSKRNKTGRDLPEFVQ